MDDSFHEMVLRIPAMDCLSEQQEINIALENVSGLKRREYDLEGQTIKLFGDSKSLSISKAIIEKLGYETEHIKDQGSARKLIQQITWSRLIIALCIALSAEIVQLFFAADWLGKLMVIMLSLTSILLVGPPVYLKGIASLRRYRLNMNALMSVAVTGAFLIGHWPEAGMVMALYSMAEELEGRAATRARRAIEKLNELSPDDACVLKSNNKWKKISIKDVSIGELVRVEAGERIPLDGVICEGRTAINQSSVTGESMPIDKKPGDQVFAGTLNTTGSFIFKVSSTESESTISRIIQAVENAQSSRAPMQRFVDRFAARYTPTVFMLAVLVALLSPVLIGISHLDAVYRALVLLVIACPCALVIATPITLVSGLTAAARMGIVIKGGLFLEQIRCLQTIAFDKTGTLTTGRPALVAFEPSERVINTSELKSWCISLAERSNHPVSKAIRNGLAAESYQVEDYETKIGLGVEGRIGQKQLYLGNIRWLNELQLIEPEIELATRKHIQNGQTVSLLADHDGVLAILAVADQPRPTAAQTIEQIKQLGIETVMISGDNRKSAELIAQRLGVQQVMSELLPEDKLEVVKMLQSKNPTGMVGDGINDAPALAGAQVGFAMGAAGSDTAMEAADVVIMNDDPRKLVDTILISQKTHNIMWQNITLILIIKGTFLLSALSGIATMWQAVFADMGTSLIVIFNSLRLLHKRSPKKSSQLQRMFITRSSLINFRLSDCNDSYSITTEVRSSAILQDR